VTCCEKATRLPTRSDRSVTVADPASDGAMLVTHQGLDDDDGYVTGRAEVLSPAVKAASRTVSTVLLVRSCCLSVGHDLPTPCSSSWAVVSSFAHGQGEE
jgi:hypothetical protein